MKRARKKLLFDTIVNFLFLRNDKETRIKLKNSIEEVMGFPFIDATTIHHIDNNYVFFYGYDEKTGKTIDITIKPTFI